MREQYMKRLAIFSVLFSAVAMGVMLYFLSVKTVVIADELPATVNTTEEVSRELFFCGENAKDAFLNIPVSPEIRADNITIENRMIEQCVNIFITGEKQDFYEDNPLSGNFTQVLDGRYGFENSVVKIRLELNDIYETEYEFTNGMLKIRFAEPGELYERIVVLDTGNEEGIQSESVRSLVDGITLDIVERVMEKLKADNIKVYSTRAGEDIPDIDKRIKLVNNSDADMAVGIFVNSDAENSENCGTETVYNQDYFIPVMGSIELADFLEREVVISTSGIAKGLKAVPAEDISMVREAKVPAAQILIGYITNEKEAALLLKEDYREKIAEGIYKAIIKAFEKKETIG